MGRATFTAGELRFLAWMRVGHLATADNAGRPHAIPIVFAADGQRLYAPLDQKPKRVEPHQLKRARNIQANPHVAVIVDRYDEDWTQLGWVLIVGTAKLFDAGEGHVTGVRLLRDKYPQYEHMALEQRPVIVVTPTSIASWGKINTVTS